MAFGARFADETRASVRPGRQLYGHACGCVRNNSPAESVDLCQAPMSGIIALSS